MTSRLEIRREENGVYSVFVNGELYMECGSMDSVMYALSMIEKLNASGVKLSEFGEPVKTIEFTIPFTPVTKKNHARIIYVGGHPRILPSEQYQDYERKTKKLFKQVAEDDFCPIDSPCCVEAHYYMPTRRRVDLLNLHAALHDLMTAAGIVQDDNSNIIVSTDGSRVHYDKDNPRTEVKVYVYAERQERS